MRAVIFSACLALTSCDGKDSAVSPPPPPTAIEITGGALEIGLETRTGEKVEKITLDPEEHERALGEIYDRLTSDAKVRIAPPEALLASEHLRVRFPDGRQYYMISSSLLELNGQWYEGDFDYAMAGTVRYVHKHTDCKWNSKHLYSRYPTRVELEEIRIQSMIKQFPELDPSDIRKSFEQTGGEQAGADQPATAPESKPEDRSKPEPESELRPQ